MCEARRTARVLSVCLLPRRDLKGGRRLRRRASLRSATPARHHHSASHACVHTPSCLALSYRDVSAAAAATPRRHRSLATFLETRLAGELTLGSSAKNKLVQGRCACRYVHAQSTGPQARVRRRFASREPLKRRVGVSQEEEECTRIISECMHAPAHSTHSSCSTR